MRVAGKENPAVSRRPRDGKICRLILEILVRLRQEFYCRLNNVIQDRARRRRVPLTIRRGSDHVERVGEVDRYRDGGGGRLACRRAARRSPGLARRTAADPGAVRLRADRGAVPRLRDLSVVARQADVGAAVARRAGVAVRRGRGHPDELRLPSCGRPVEALARLLGRRDDCAAGRVEERGACGAAPPASRGLQPQARGDRRRHARDEAPDRPDARAARGRLQSRLRVRRTRRRSPRAARRRAGGAPLRGTRAARARP